MEKRWVIAPPITAAQAADYRPYQPLMAQLLVNRGLSAAAAESFFSSDNETQWHTPLAFKKMSAAVALIVAKIKAGERLAICGDYDADGVTASAVLAETLRTLKAQLEVWIPNRLTEGYGLNSRVLREIKDAGCSLVITVDNGIRSRAEIAAAQKLGLTVIVTDHHAAPDEAADWPDCLIINPMLPGETYPFKYLAGVGVAFKLACALIEASTLAPAVKERLVNRIVDLVAIGTVADCVNILGENRFLVRQGLKAINRRSRVGLDELIKVSQLNGEIETWNISWQLAPRLNVAGRLEHANTAYELLMTADRAQAAALAKKLNEQNHERQTETQRLMEYSQNFVETNLADDKLLIVTSPNLTDDTADAWHEGIIGLVAGRLCERYGKPALVITLSDGKIKGSGRSIEGYNILAVLETNKAWLERFGGHKAACGFTIKDKAALTAFAAAARAQVKQELSDEDLLPRLLIDAELDLMTVDERMVEDLERLAPFGQGNKEPLFVSRRLVVRDKLTMGVDGQHVKFKFNNFWAVAFGEAAKWQTLAIGSQVDAAYTLEFNDFNGFRNIQLRLVDMKPSLS